MKYDGGDIRSHRSPHPRVGMPRFIARLGQGQQALMPLLIDRGVRTTIAPLHFMSHNPQLSMFSTAEEMGLVLDPFTHLRQLPRADRSEAFRALPFGNDAEAYDADRSRLSDNELVHLAVDPVDAQVGRGATLLLTSFHIAGGHGTRGRDIELALARTGVEHFRRQRLEEPPPLGPLGTPREIFATVAVRASELASSARRQALADAYLEVGADGVWVKIEGFHERASLPSIRAASGFLSALRDGGIPVVSCGAGQLHLALLADDISASIGLSEGERFSMPTRWRSRTSDGKRRGRTRMALHPKMHRSFRVGSDEAARAFSSDPCGCGVHSASKPPTGLLVARHAAILRAEQAREAMTGLPAERREWLLAASQMASWKAADAGIKVINLATARYQAVFEGLDAGRDVAAPGEQAEL